MSEETSFHFPSSTPFHVAGAALLALIIAAGAYAIHEHSAVKQLTAQNSAVTSTLNATRDQMSALNSRLDALTVQQATEKPLAPVYRKPLTPASTHHRIDDPRWKKVQGQLDDQAKQIDSTRQDIANARTELQGSIAMTHDELVLLEKKGERSYYEFDLDKNGQFQREGPVGLRLRKANTKHEYADLELLVDDLKVSKKHVNIFEPVLSYSGDRKMPVELVINSISKNHIHGYVSEPKYKAGEVEAMANSPTNPPASETTSSSQNTAPAKPSPIRPKLPPPDEN
jgi:hypothetical protein